MENKHVGYLLLGVSVLMILVILLFNSALSQIIESSCTAEHALVCPMEQTLNQQTYLSFGIVGFLVLVSLFLIFGKPQKEIIIKTKTVEKRHAPKQYTLSELTLEEKKVFELVLSQKAVFQSDLIEKTGLGKAKMTRIIDRLEGKGFVERKRRGMTNIVVLKE